MRLRNGNGSVINQGNIWLDVAGGGLTFNAQPFINEGLVQVIPNGGANLWGGNGVQQRDAGDQRIDDAPLQLLHQLWDGQRDQRAGYARWRA